MKKFFVFALLCTAVIASAAVTAYRNGKDLFVQSRFSDTHDIIVQVWLDANEKAWLVPRNSDIRQAHKGLLLHSNSDEYPATNFTHYGFLSGNHGSAAARLVTAPGHGLKAEDSGKIITDEKKNSYVLVSATKNQFVMHPEPAKPAPVGRAVFFRHSKEKLFFNGKEIKFTRSVLAQLRPLNVVTKSVFLIDGKTPLADKQIVKCEFVDHIFEHGVIAPEAAVKYIKDHPGERNTRFFTTRTKMFYPDKEKGFEDYAALPRIMTVKNRMRYQDNGAMVNTRTCIFPVSLRGVSQMDIMFGWTGAISKGNYQMFYIPKTKVQHFKGHKNKAAAYTLDFVRGVNISKGLDINGSVTSKDSIDPARLPDRFIRVTGKDSPEYGIALGYSLFEGFTSADKKGAGRNSVYHHWYTRKMYPYAYNLYNNAPGTVRTSVSYKQYFCPKNDPDATAFYYHKQGKSDVVYFEAHKPLKNKKIKLPPYMTGKKVTVLEKTPELTFSGKTVPAKGLEISSKANYSHIVLKLD